MNTYIIHILYIFKVSLCSRNFNKVKKSNSTYLIFAFILLFSTQEVTFPAFTICPDYFNSYKREILSRNGLNVKDIWNSITFPQNLNGSLADFFEEVTYDLEEVVYSVEVGTGIKLHGTNETSFKFINRNITSVPGTNLCISFISAPICSSLKLIEM